MVDVQTYEEYWKVTLAYTDIHSNKFRKTLKIMRDFIYNKKQIHTEEDFNDAEFKKRIYAELQTLVKNTWDINEASIRKALNQFVKLGFIRPGLLYYDDLTDKFLNAKTNEHRRRIFSEIVYKKSKFNSSVSNDNAGGHLKFLINTLTHVGKLTKSDIGALMCTDIREFEDKGYLSEEELSGKKEEIANTSFLERKYNQSKHFQSILANLNGLRYHDNVLYFDEDAERLFPPDYERRGRDVYLHTIFKDELKKESCREFNEIKCMVENIAYPILIASHIKPWRKSTEIEAYDPSNGLLLTRSMDALFDQGEISFEDNGEIILADCLPKSTYEYLNGLSIHNVFLTNERITYLKYHRVEILKA